MNRILCGTIEYTDDDLLGGSATFGNSVLGDELSIDSLSFSIHSDGGILNGLFVITGNQLEAVDGDLLQVRGSTDEDPSLLEYGTDVYWYQDGTLKGHFYLSEVVRTARSTFSVTAVSAVGLLDKIQHYGGVYSSVSFSTMISGIIGGLVPYSIDATLANYALTGWLPVDSARNNLQQVLFAAGASVRKDANGDLFFTVLDDSTATAITDATVYRTGSVASVTPATRIDVTVHDFTQNAATASEVIYETSTAVSGVLVTWSEPYYSISASGLTISEQGANYAVVSGTGSLSGKKYLHQTTTESETVGSGTEKVVSITNATLVSAINAATVLTRAKNYYTSAQEVEAQFVLADQRAGDFVTFTDVFGDERAGFIRSLEVTFGPVNTARAVIIADYSPPGLGYTNSLLITSGGTISIPAADTVMFVLIGKGEDGTNGEAGEDGGNSYKNSGDISDGADGDGGQGGTGGAGGKILKVTVKRTDATAVLTIGDDVTLEYDGVTYSSADGQASVDGYTDPISGDVYASPGEDGIAGKSRRSGNRYNTIVWEGTTYRAGASGSDFSGTGIVYTEASGGHGGGPAGGGNGIMGASASFLSYRLQGGDGGDGGNGANGSGGVHVGDGGDGGNGGGGGGGGGGARMVGYDPQITMLTSYGGNGGTGGSGGAGHAGGILIIY